MKTKNLIFIIAGSILIHAFLFSGNADAQTRHKLVKEGNEMFQDGEYDEAIARYHMAEDKGEASEIDFNLGNAFFKSGNLGRAAEVYMKALNDTNSTLRSQAFYNLGNALLDSGLADMAVKSYINSLLLNPNDMDTKQNLEYALRQMQQQQKQQQQNDDKSENEDQEQQQQQEQDQQEQQEKEQQNQEQQQQEQQQQQPQERQVEMSKEDALKLLKALENDEKEVQKKVVQKKMEGRKDKGKKW